MGIDTLKRHLRVWLFTTKLAIQNTLANRGSATFFLLGKWLRLFLFTYFIVLIGEHVQQVEGYSTADLITFYLVFNLFDLTGQIFFRGIYWFSEQIISGEFDFRLVKPLSPLFQALTRETDILDVPMLLLIIGVLISQNLSTPPLQLAGFFLLAINALLIITAIHIVVASLGVITTEVDHTIMIYRDLSAMARFPVDIYVWFIRGVITFVIPIAIAFTYPAQALLGLLSPTTIIISFVAGLLSVFLSLRLWRYALTQYSSASS
jgi:ABC-2 type transport system permease protein